MPGDFTVVVATYGDRRWERLARRRAIPSALGQAPVEHVHGPSLHEARNEGLARVRSEFVVFLDADDQLAPGYIDAMAAADGDLRVPQAQIMRRFRAGEPFTVRVYGHTHDCCGECLREGNFMLIGTAVRASIARQVGGFEPWAYAEDRAFFARCWLAGASIERAPGAIYRVRWSRHSRNRGHATDFKRHWMAQIDAAVFS